MLTHNRLHELLIYDPLTGVFKWRNTSRRQVAGAVAGTVANNGYIRIKVDGPAYLAHRLAWLYSYGSFPLGYIDHKDRDKQNNAISNLRIVTQAQNCANASSKSNNKSGVKGVHFDKYSDKWVASITSNGSRWSSKYATLEEAITAVGNMRNKLHKEFAHH